MIDRMNVPVKLLLMTTLLIQIISAYDSFASINDRMDRSGLNDQLFVLGRNGFEPVISPVYFERLEASAFIDSGGEPLLTLKYTHFIVKGMKQEPQKPLYDGNLQMLVHIVLANQELISVKPVKQVNPFFESGLIMHHGESHISTTQGFNVYCVLTSNMLEQINNVPVVEVRFEILGIEGSPKKMVTIYADGRELQGKKSDRKWMADRYRQGWLNLMDYYHQLTELVRGA
jgi:hypothetical protein